jgi:class 3 adenylate cyclase/YHS domain-containing protein
MRRTATRKEDTVRRAALLRSYVAPEVVAHIMSDGRVPLLSGLRLPVTVLFADIRGFTRLAERLPAEHVVALLDDFFGAMSAAALAHRAVIDKLIGDAVMLLFGVPAARGDEADRAMRTALEMHRRFAGVVARWVRTLPAGSPLGLGIGCASGEAILANVGSAARMDYTAIGAPVNLAARLAALAPPGATFIDCVMLERVSVGVRGAVRVGRPRLLVVKGVHRRVAVYACTARARPSVPRATKTVEDPVCGMKVERRSAVTRIYRGRRHYFCSRACADGFAAAPAAYLGRRVP